MITPSEIKEKAIRLYPQFINAWLRGEEFFPRRIPASLTLPRDYAEAKRSVELLRKGSKQSCGHGYHIRWQTRKSRWHGLNEFPTEILFECERDFLESTDQAREFRQLNVAVLKIREQQPMLLPWLLESTHWKDLLKVAGHLDELLMMTHYLTAHARPDCFAREIPLPVSTKLVEENRQILAAWLDRLLSNDQIDFRFGRDEFEARYGLRYVRHHLLVRCLDPIFQQKMELKFDELSIPAESIDQLPVESPIAFIVENKINLLTLPTLKNGLAIGGLGKAVSLLQDVTWLTNVPIYYWGDLDIEGFEILSQFRQMFPQTQSFLMDMATLSKFRHLAIAWSNCGGGLPVSLNESELQTYQYLVANRIRLEQERIPQSEVCQQLSLLAIS